MVTTTLMSCDDKPQEPEDRHVEEEAHAAARATKRQSAAEAGCPTPFSTCK